MPVGKFCYKAFPVQKNIQNLLREQEHHKTELKPCSEYTFTICPCTPHVEAVFQSEKFLLLLQNNVVKSNHRNTGVVIFVGKQVLSPFMKKYFHSVALQTEG